MSLKETIQNDIKEAMKNHEEAHLLVLRGLNAAFNNKEIEKRTKLAKTESQEKLDELSKLSDEEIIDVLFAEVKKRKEAIVEFEKGKREDLASKEKAELEILQKYLPEQLSEDEIRKMAEAVIAQTGAKEMKDMGKVLGQLMQKTKGKAEGGTVSQIVKNLLSAQ